MNGHSTPAAQWMRFSRAALVVGLAAAAMLGADCLTGILNHPQPATFGNFENRIHLRGNAEGMRHHQGARPWGNGVFDPARIDVQRFRIDIHKDRHCALVANRIGGGDEGERGNDDLVALPNLQRANTQMQPGGSGADGDGVRRGDTGRDRRFKLLCHRAEAEPRGAQHGDDCFNLRFGDVGRGQGQREHRGRAPAQAHY